MARTRDRAKEIGRVNVYLSPDAVDRINRASAILFPGRKRTDGIVIEEALKVLERKLEGRMEGRQREDESPALPLPG